MTVSMWRFSHFTLAVVSFLFIAVAAITGIVLAFEPVSQQMKPYAVSDLGKVSVARLVPEIKKGFPEIIDLKIENGRFVILNAVDDNGEQQRVYIHPETAQVLGNVREQSAFFKTVTTLHRSLFMHGLGRLFIGISSFLLLLIAVSGIFMILQRQGGIKRFFSRLVKESFFQYYHVYLGRILLVPILLIAITGTYLFLIHLKIISPEKISHQVTAGNTDSKITERPEQLSVFNTIFLSEVQSIEFPFSDDPEDYFTVKLKDRELVINQYSGAVLSEIPYKTGTLLANLSLDLHTGRKSLLWAMVLAASAANILFFIYSGFAISIRRRKGKIKNKYSAADATFILLAGSENGTTLHVAYAMHRQLLKLGIKSYISDLNNYDVFPKATHLIVMTSTYGLGTAPGNANRFISKLNQIKQAGKIHFSVVGFGSRQYPDFCRFASDVYAALSCREWAEPFLPLHTVNNKSKEEFKRWVDGWSAAAGIPLTVPVDLLMPARKHSNRFRVIEKTENENGTFLLRLKSLSTKKFDSGDLFAVSPSNEHAERFYSVAKINKEIQLIVRLHPGGIGSGYLHALQKSDVFKASIINNPGFHFPKNVQTVICICNGTGIAPFLGMIDQNTERTAIHLYCGFRSSGSLSLYESFLKKSQADNKLKHLHVAYSREEHAQYVSDILLKDSAFIAQTLKDKGVIMICGSLNMQADVMRCLEDACIRINGEPISYYQDKKQILIDCY